MEKFTFFFTKFQIKGFSLRTQLLQPPHSLPNMYERFCAKKETDWTAGKKRPQPFSLIRRIVENKSVCGHVASSSLSKKGDHGPHVYN